MQNNHESNCFSEFEIARTTDFVNFSQDNETEKEPGLINKNTTTNLNLQNVRQLPNITASNSTNSLTVASLSNNNSKINGKELGFIAQKIFGDIKAKRDHDKTRCDEFEACIKIWSDELTKKAIESLEYYCEKKSKIIKENFMEIEKDLNDIGKMEMELENIQNQVEALYQQTRV